MSEQEAAGRHEGGLPEDDHLFEASGWMHENETEVHDRRVLEHGDRARASSGTSADEECPTPTAAASGGDPVDESHLDTPHAPIFPSSSSGGSRAPSVSSQPSTLAQSMFTASETLVGSEDSQVKPLAIGMWQNLPRLFDRPRDGSPIESPTSPLTLRTAFPNQTSSSTTATSDPGQSPANRSIGQSPLSHGSHDPEYEGVSLHTPPFTRPRSRNSSAPTVRSLPALLTPDPRGQTVRFPFIDLLAPRSEVSAPEVGLPSIRHIIDSGEPQKDKIPDIHKDVELVSHLEALQLSVLEKLKKAHAASEKEKVAIMEEVAVQCWSSSFHFLREVVRSHKFLRNLSSEHRISLSEIEKIRRDSKDTAGRISDKERHLSLDINGLKAQNAELKRQLVLRDMALAKAKNDAATDSSLKMGQWLGNQPFVAFSTNQVNKNPEDADADDRSQVDLEGEIEPDMLPGEKPKKDFADTAEPPETPPPRRDSWQPNQDDTLELLQKIRQLRDDKQHEMFEKEAAQEQVKRLERELDIAMGISAHEDSTTIPDIEQTASKRKAEKVGMEAALKTSQQNLASAQAEIAILRETVDELEEKMAERDHKIKRVQLALARTQIDLDKERRERTEVEFKLEEVSNQLAETEKQLDERAAEVNRLENEIEVLIVDIRNTESELADERAKNKSVAEQLYDQQTDNGMMVQDLEFEQRKRAEAEAALKPTQDEFAQLQDLYNASLAELEQKKAELEKSTPVCEAKLSELRQQVHDLADALTQKDTLIKEKHLEIKSLEAECAAYKHTSTRLAEHIRSIRGDEGQKKIEDLRKRRIKLKKQHAVWVDELRKMDVRKTRAHQRYRLAHKAAWKAIRELDELRQQADFDVGREERMMERVEDLEQESEMQRLELQDLHMWVTTAGEILRAHAAEIEDVEGILKEFGGAGLVGELETPKDKPVINLADTALPQAPITPEPSPPETIVITKPVEHHHSEACFCTLVEHWFPGLLDKVMPPRRRDTDDESGYASGNSDADGSVASPGPLFSPGFRIFSALAPSSPRGKRSPGLTRSQRSALSVTKHTKSPQPARPSSRPAPAGMFCDVLFDSPQSAKFTVPKKTVAEEPQQPEGPRRMRRAPTEYLKRPRPTNFVYHTDVVDTEVLLGPLREEAQDSTGATEYGSDDWLGPMPLRGGAGSPSSLPSGAFSSLDDFEEDNDETDSDGDGSLGELARRTERQADETFEDKCARLGVPADIIKEFMEEEREREAKREAPPVLVTDEEDESRDEDGGDLQEVVKDVNSPPSSPVRFPDEEQTESDNAVEPNPAQIPSHLYPDDMMDAYIAEWEQTRPASGHESAAASQPSPVKVQQPQPRTPPRTPQRKREPFSWELSESVTTAAQQFPRTPTSAIPRRRTRFASAAPTPQKGTPPQSPPHKKARVTTDVEQEDQDPITSLLNLIESGNPTPPPSGVDLTVPITQARHYYHGHTTTTPDGPFHSPLHLICQFLTALTWLAMLILTQPSNLLSTLAIITSYFLLPLGWILHLVLYYIRLLPHNLSRLDAWILNQPVPPQTIPRPARPVLGTPSAAAMVSSVISLVVVFTVVALEAVMYEREVWVRANSWTAAYVRDIIERQPYPWWSPVRVDFRLAVMDWVGWKVNAWAFPGRYLRTW